MTPVLIEVDSKIISAEFRSSISRTTSVAPDHRVREPNTAVFDTRQSVSILRLHEGPVRERGGELLRLGFSGKIKNSGRLSAELG